MTPEEAIAAVEKACAAFGRWWHSEQCTVEEPVAEMNDLREALPVLRALLADAKLGRELRELVALAKNMTISEAHQGWVAVIDASGGSVCPTLDAAVSAALARARTP